MTVPAAVTMLTTWRWGPAADGPSKTASPPPAEAPALAPGVAGAATLVAVGVGVGVADDTGVTVGDGSADADVDGKVAGWWEKSVTRLTPSASRLMTMVAATTKIATTPIRTSGPTRDQRFMAGG
jgi:hypothetical protein